ncbi:MAG: hypothetical protein ACP5IV_07500, partial [Caldisericia bacterium]
MGFFDDLIKKDLESEVQKRFSELNKKIFKIYAVRFFEVTEKIKKLVALRMKVNVRTIEKHDVEYKRLYNDILDYMANPNGLKKFIKFFSNDRDFQYTLT